MSPTGKRDLGKRVVYGTKRVPWPPARMIACGLYLTVFTIRNVVCRTVQDVCRSTRPPDVSLRLARPVVSSPVADALLNYLSADVTLRWLKAAPVPVPSRAPVHDQAT